VKSTLKTAAALGEKVRNRPRMAAMMLMLINFNSDCGIIVKIYSSLQPFLAATFDFPNFFTQVFYTTFSQLGCL